MAYTLEGLAHEIWDKKYRAKEDSSVEDTWLRVARAIASIEQDKERWEQGFYELLHDFTAIPGGRITNGAGTANNYLLNCSVIPIFDSLAGEQSIARTAEKAAFMSKRNYGVGIDFSPIRPKGAELSGGGSASGVVSFMRVFDTWCSVIQDGGGRRSALIGILRVDHPDILEFIDAKRQENVLTQFNISVGITDEFLEAVKSNREFDLRFEGQVCTTVKAREIWNRLVKSGYNYNDPGILYLDQVNKFNNGYYMYDIAATNPCFTGDMRLLTTGGYRPFAELSGKDVTIINHEGTPVIGSVWCSGVKPVVEVKFWDNKYPKIKCTPDHRFMLVDGSECEAKDLKGKRIKPFFEAKDKFEREPFLAGFVQGDGCTGRLDSDEHLGLEVNLGAKDGDVLRFLGAEVVGRNWYSREAKDVAIKYGLSSQCLPYRIMPQREWSSDKELADFLSGLWSANGSVIRGHRVAFKSTCRELIDQLQVILKDTFKIESYVTTNKASAVKFNNGTYCCKESYDLNINRLPDLVEFASKIGFCQEYKRKDLADLIMQKAPKVRTIVELEAEPVYDFSEPLTHWGVVEGVVAHNCGELPLPPDAVCDLGSINLTRFVRDPFSKSVTDWKNNFEWGKYDQAIITAVRFLDNVLDVSDYPYDEITVRAKGDRRIGLNCVAGFGSFLAMMKVPYDSPEAIVIAEQLQQHAMELAYNASVDLAIEKGSFPNFDREQYIQANFIQNLDVQTQKRIYNHGIRNLALLTIPPVGTGSLIAGNISNGLEPIFSLEYTRKVRQADGSTKQEPVEDWAWKLYKTLGKPDGEKPEYFKTSREIAPKAHIDVQAKLQKYIDGSISKTVNMPESTTLKEYEELLWYSLENGCKGFTSFREGTREGVLEVKPKETKVKTKEPEEKIKAVEPKKKRPRVLHGTTYKIKDDLGNIYVTINNIEEKGKSKPFEIFIESNSETASVHSEWYKALSKLMSAVMRRTDDIEFMINDLKSIYAPKGYFSDGQYMQSKPQMIGNILQEHWESTRPELKKEAKPSKCPECGELSYIREGGCTKCLTCGYASCAG